MKKVIVFLVLFAAVACQFSTSSSYKTSEPSQEFKDYWYKGDAEISVYDLEQARYGEMRKGKAVAIFVTEDFSGEKQVKLDDPDKAKGKIRILKMNMMKNFVTGIYPYSMMLSVFKPISVEQYIPVMKITSSAQEWCGNTFTQLNFRENAFHYRLFSYFESESDVEVTFEKVWTEDELWAQIRLNPDLLPVGKFKALPGIFAQRLMHYKFSFHDVVGKNTKCVEIPSWLNQTSNIFVYQLDFPDLKRELKIYYSTKFPRAIVGWEETYPDGFGEKKKILATKASLTKTLKTDYWKHNAVKDSILRQELKLNTNTSY